MNKRDIENRMIYTMYSLFNRQVAIAEKAIQPTANQIEHKEGSFPFIANHDPIVLEQFIRLKDYLYKEDRWSGYESESSRRFVDAGSGIGNILLMANEVNLCREYIGLEYFDKTIKLGRKFIKSYYPHDKRIRLEKRNILTYKSYGKADIIYYYCPFNDKEKEIEFENLIEDQMKVGAILIPYLKADIMIYKDDRFELLTISHKNMFIKIK